VLLIGKTQFKRASEQLMRLYRKACSTKSRASRKGGAVAPVIEVVTSADHAVVVPVDGAAENTVVTEEVVAGVRA